MKAPYIKLHKLSEYNYRTPTFKYSTCQSDLIVATKSISIKHGKQIHKWLYNVLITREYLFLMFENVFFSEEDVSNWYSQVFAPADEVLTTPRLEFRLTGLKPATTYKVRGKLFLHNLPVSPESDTYRVRTMEPSSVRLFGYCIGISS